MIAYAPEQTKTHNDIEFERYQWESISLYDFVCEFWEVIEPGKKFVSGRHIEAICEHLEAVLDGKITRLIVNMPPRHAKSSIISVLFRAWAWMKNPSIRFLCASYALSLATRDNVKVRRLILSQKFQQHYGHLFTLTKDQNAKIKFENDHRGASQAVSVGSSTTGEGFDVGIIDDPHSIDETRSDLTREGTLEWFKDTWCTRPNDPKTSAMIVVGQRVHEQDLSGYILSGETGEHWVHLNLATEFEPLDRCVTHLPNDTRFWQDWRELEGELLWEDRFPQEVVERAKRRHGPFAYAALYQQRPTPATGGIFDQRNERAFEESHDTYFLHTPKGVKSVKKADCSVFMTVDPAISEKQTADYTVIGTWAQTPIRDLLLLNVRRGHWGHAEQQDEIEEEFRESGAEYVAVEVKAYQAALFQDLLIKGIMSKPFDPKTDKVLRSNGSSIWHRNGKMYFRLVAAWLEDLQKELYKFPKAAKDDQVDMMSMAGIAVRSRGPLSEDPDDEDDIPDPIEGPLDKQETLSFTQHWYDPESVVPVIPPRKDVDPFSWVEQHGGWE